MTINLSTSQVLPGWRDTALLMAKRTADTLLRELRELEADGDSVVLVAQAIRASLATVPKSEGSVGQGQA